MHYYYYYFFLLLIRAGSGNTPDAHYNSSIYLFSNLPILFPSPYFQTHSRKSRWWYNSEDFKLPTLHKRAHLASTPSSSHPHSKHRDATSPTDYYSPLPAHPQIIFDVLIMNRVSLPAPRLFPGFNLLASRIILSIVMSHWFHTRLQINCKKYRALSHVLQTRLRSESHWILSARTQTLYIKQIILYTKFHRIACTIHLLSTRNNTFMLG